MRSVDGVVSDGPAAVGLATGVADSSEKRISDSLTPTAGRSIADQKPPWGPWSPALTDPAERKAQLRQLATLVHVIRVPGQADTAPLVRTLREAEPPIIEESVSVHDGIRIGNAAVYLERARWQFDLLPTLVQRRIIATIAEVTKRGRGDIR